MPLVYEQLRRLAAHKMASQPPGQTIQATALVHEAWLKLAGEGPRHWKGSKHFYSTAVKAMRQILIDRARRKQCVRHGGGLERTDLAEIEIAVSGPANNGTFLALNEAIEELEQEDQLKAQIVKLKFFVGLTENEIASQLEISERTVKRHWAFARAWLFERIGEAE